MEHKVLFLLMRKGEEKKSNIPVLLDLNLVKQEAR